MLLPACGGGSSSSAGAGGADSRTYQQGYAAGTVATLDIVLADLRAVQASLAGEGAPAQTSRGPLTLGRSLEPRQRETLAASLLTFITRVAAARDAASAPTAGRTEADAAQEAADDALRALQLVIAADTAERAGGSDEVQTAAIDALNQIARVDVTAPDARTRINEVLQNALAAAEREVADLERRLAAAQAAAGQAGQAAGTAADTITSLQASLTAARNSLNALTARFGSSPGAAASRAASTRYHARRTGATVWFDLDGTAPDFDATGNWNVGTRYHLVSRGTAVTGGFDLTPDAVLYNPAGSNPRVFTTTAPNASHFPGRGVVYRGGLRHVLDGDTNANNNDHVRRDWIYGVADRLIVQGANAEACSGANDTDVGTTCPAAGANGNPSGAITSGKMGINFGVTNDGKWDNWDGSASMTFQYKASGGFTMGFGGEGVIFGDLERYVARGGGGPDTTGATTCTGGGGTGGTAPAGEYCDDPTTANVEISFGTPQADPYGERDTNYWNVQVPSPRLPADPAADSQADAVSFDPARSGNQIAGHDAGRYELLLSNYAGEDRRLAYAAYGLFNFVDTGTTNQRIGRMQLFHYGLDAFADSDDRRTTDLSGSSAIEGTFQGHTTAWIVTSQTKQSGDGALTPVKQLFRARGELEMRACIGAAGTSCTIQDFAATPSALDVNRVTGYIRNLEYAWGNRPGFHWTKSKDGGINGAQALGTEARTGVILEPAEIGADGAYSGVTRPWFLPGARPGTYEGAFYGPAGAGLETAGTWQINFAAWSHLDWDAIIGSFGAVCEGTCRPSPSP